ncbi:helix-turn-helix transcriptional regulator [Motilimonas cestriensis]|uniref:helix-turn-helix transcriptional regulator n=1 Tax=Motilimonas cestriensis TaxID=2742685 RepID=UPI003DA489DF
MGAKLGTDEIVRSKQLQEELGIAHSTIYAWIEKGYLPKPVRFSPRYVGWYRSQLEEWKKQTLLGAA